MTQVKFCYEETQSQVSNGLCSGDIATPVSNSQGSPDFDSSWKENKKRQFESICGKRRVEEGLEYLVKWVDWPSSCNSWVAYSKEWSREEVERAVEYERWAIEREPDSFVDRVRGGLVVDDIPFQFDLKDISDGQLEKWFKEAKSSTSMDWLLKKLAEDECDWFKALQQLN